MRRRGFTLLEALIALGVILLLMGVVTQVVQDVANARDRSRRDGLRLQGVSTAFELLGTAADTCFTGNGQTGIEGGPVNLRITRSGVQARRLLGNDEQTSPLSDRELFQLGLDGEDLFVGTDDSSTRSVLLEDLTAIRFRYFDGTGWLESWNSSTQGLPHAIELSIWTTPWPEGMTPAWMPQEETEPTEDAPSLEEEPFLAEFEPTFPPPEKQRVVAIFDPASSSGGIDGFSTGEGDVSGDFSP